jgi:hypothetical protein
LSKTPAQVKREADEAKAEEGADADDEGGNADGESSVRKTKRNGKATVVQRRNPVTSLMSINMYFLFVPIANMLLTKNTRKRF